MKKAKTLLALALVIVVMFSFSTSAFAAVADDAQYKTTKALLTQIDGLEGLEYTVAGIISSDGTNYEKVLLNYSGDLSNYTSNIVAFFNEDCDEVTFCLFNLINFDEANLADVLAKINNINATTLGGMKLYVDTSDNSVTAELYQLVSEESAADLLPVAFGFVIGYTDQVFELLQDYAI